MTPQKFMRWNFGSLSASTSALTLPNVVSGLCLMPSHVRNARDNTKDRRSHLRHQLFNAGEPTRAADADNLIPPYRRVQRNRLAPLVQRVAAYQACSQAFLHGILDM